MLTTLALAFTPALPTMLAGILIERAAVRRLDSLKTAARAQGERVELSANTA